MTNIIGSTNSIVVTNDKLFPYENGKITIPKNSLYIVLDESDYVTFRSVANGDIVFTGNIGSLQIEGESVTKENIISKFDAVSNAQGSGGEGLKYEKVDELPTEGRNGVIYLVLNEESTEEHNVYDEYIYTYWNFEKLGSFKTEVDLSDYYTKEEADERYVRIKYNPTADTYVAWADADGNWTVDYYDDGAVPYAQYSGRTDVFEVEIGDGITSFSYYDDNTVIGRYKVKTFASCTNLKKVTIGSGITKLGYYSVQTSSRDGSNIFNGCTSLTSVTLPSTLEIINRYAFYNCTSLSSVTIPNSVTTIGEDAFQNCSSLTSVDIPNSVTYIGNYAFENCEGLTSVTIPNSVTSIRQYVFQSCSGLTSVTIPNSVTSIGDGVFWNCSGITSVTIPNSVTSIGTNAFYNVPSQGTLYCDDDWFNNLSDANKTNLGNVTNWTRKPLPKTLEERVDEIESNVITLTATLEDGTTKTYNILGKEVQ